MKFRFECGTRLMPSTERYVLLCVFQKFPTLIQKLHDNGLYGFGTARSNRINMPRMKKDKEMKWGDYQCKFYNHIACINHIATGRNNIYINRAKKIEGFFI